MVRYFSDLRNDGSSSFVEAPIIKGEIKYFEDMMDDFLNSISAGKKLFIDPHDVLRSIRLIDTCYSNPEHFDLPWCRIR
jgi:hypothetical protein